MTSVPQWASGLWIDRSTSDIKHIRASFHQRSARIASKITIAQNETFMMKMTESPSHLKTPASQVPPFFFIQLTEGDGKVSRNSGTAEAVRYYLADRKKRNKVVNAALLRDPSVRRISTGWQKLEATGSSTASASDSETEVVHESGQISQPMACSGRQLEHLLVAYVQTVVPVARGYSQHWKWCGDLEHIKSIPMLAYASAAYTSAFFTTFLTENQDISGLWLDLETKSLSWLRRALKTGASREDWTPTITLLMRLAWLLGDSETAQMHADALEKLLALDHSRPINMDTERRFVGKDGRTQIAKLLQGRNASRQS